MVPQQHRKLTTNTAAQCTIEGEDFPRRRLTHPTELTRVFLILDWSTDALHLTTRSIRTTNLRDSRHRGDGRHEASMGIVVGQSQFFLEQGEADLRRGEIGLPTVEAQMDVSISCARSVYLSAWA